MRTLTKLLAPAIAAGIALGSVAPATAADWRHDDRAEMSRFAPARHGMFRGDIVELRRDIDRAAARRLISPREAAGLRSDVADIQRLHAALSRDGLDRREVRLIDSKIDRVKSALRYERHDRDGRRY